LEGLVLKKLWNKNWLSCSFQAATKKNLLSRFAQPIRKIIVPEKMPDKKEKLLPPAFVSPTRLVGHRQNMLR